MNEFALQALSKSGLAAAARTLLARGGRFVVELHGIARAPVPELPAPLRPCLCSEDLRNILQWLKARFHLLTPGEFLAAERPGVLLTFDDGFANQAVEALPLLEEYRAPAIFFVTTCHVARPQQWLGFVREQLARHGSGEASEDTLHALFDGMSTDQLAACARSPYVTVGSHTVSHPLLRHCDDLQLRQELVDSKLFLERHSGQNVELLAYPTGDYDARVARVAREVGYGAAFVEDSRHLGLDTFEIPRVGLYRADGAYLAAKLSGLHRRPLPTRRAGTDPEGEA